MFPVILLLFGCLAASSSIIFIKLSTLHPALLGSYRLIIAALVLMPLFIRDYKKTSLKKILRISFIPGLLLGFHFITWIYGGRMIPAVNSTVIVNMVPVVMPFIIFFMTRERLTRRELTGTVISVSGILVLAVRDFSLDRITFIGDILCFVSMILFALYLSYSRKKEGSVSLWLYIVPIYLIGGIFCFLVGFPLAENLLPEDSSQVLYLIGLALIPTVLGHSIMNYSMGVMRAQVFSLINQSQFIFSGILAFLFLKEIPQPIFYVASPLIVAGAALVMARKKS